MVKISTITKSRLKLATYLKVMERFGTRLSKLTIAHADHTKYREAFTVALAKMQGDWKKQTASELTAKIAEADARRDRAYQTIKTVAGALANGAGSEAQTETAAAIVQVLNLYKLNTGAQLDQESGVMDNIIVDIEKSGILAKLPSLGLDKAFAEMKAATQLVDQLLDERDDERAPIQTGVMKADRAQTDAAYDAMVEYLNALLLLQPTAALEAFAAAWNAVLNRIRVQVLSQSPTTDGTVDIDIDEEENTDPSPTPTPQPDEDDDLSQE